MDASVETEEKKTEAEEGDVKETTFESPSPEEIQQLTAEPKKPIEKKLE